jgi:exo-1,4-beta-D-glucosaminidase
LKARVRLLDLQLGEHFRREVELSVPADGVVTLCQLPDRRGLSRTHFLLLELTTKDGVLHSRNFYWLSSERDVIDQTKANWYMAPLSAFASFHALAELPEASLSLERQRERENDGELVVSLRNTGTALAFFTRLRLLTAAGNEVLPAHFSDNYVSLLPGECISVVVRDARSTPGSRVPAAEVEAVGPRSARVALRL